MKSESSLRPGAKRRTNLSLAGDMLDQAKALGVNLSQAAEQGIAEALRKARAERWLEENRDAIQSSNHYLEKHGLPLARYRNF